LPVLLHRSADIPRPAAFERWCAVAGTATAVDGRPYLENAGERLEAAFDDIRDEWWTIGRALGTTPTAELAHMPTCGTYTSDFGVIMAWVQLVGTLAGERPATLVLCDDPWLFRRLAAVAGVAAGVAPRLWPRRLALMTRGFLARCRVAVRVARAMVRTRRLKGNHGKNERVIIAYAHPGSDGNGKDAYFGDLMRRMPGLKRLIHTDGGVDRAIALGGDGRTTSLHAWGRLVWALALPFQRWRPSRLDLDHPTEGWLIRRSRAIENGGGQPAMNCWQIRCQEAWLAEVRPAAVAWPWENHPWERAFVRAARSLGVRTVGYQHTVVGPHMYNQSPASNPNGAAGLPDRILCNGDAYRRCLAAWGVPEERLLIGGNFRLADARRVAYDPDAPLFVALSNHPPFAREMIDAIRPMAANGWTFVVRDHPMVPFAFAETANIRRADGPLEEQTCVSGVIYCTGTVGLEAILCHLPTLRFRPRGSIAMDILPPGLAARAVDADTLANALAEDVPRPSVVRHDILADIDMTAWANALGEPVPSTGTSTRRPING